MSPFIFLPFSLPEIPGSLVSQPLTWRLPTPLFGVVCNQSLLPRMTALYLHPGPLPHMTYLGSTTVFFLTFLGSSFLGVSCPFSTLPKKGQKEQNTNLFPFAFFSFSFHSLKLSNPLPFLQGTPMSELQTTAFLSPKSSWEYEQLFAMEILKTPWDAHAIYWGS